MPARQLRHSVTSILTFEKCPRQHHLKYVERKRPPRREIPFHWRKGTVVHAGLEGAFNAHKASTGPLPDSMGVYFEHAEAAARTSWEKEGMGEAEGGDWHDTLRQIGVSLESCGVPKREAVLGVEHKFLLSTADGSPMIGFADLTLSPGPETILIRDWKSNSSPRPTEALAGDFQLGVYGVLSRLQWPWVRKVYASHFHTPIGHENQVLITDDAQEDASTRLEAVVEMIEGAQREATAGTLPPTRPGAACVDCVFHAWCPDSPSNGGGTEESKLLDGF